MAYVHYGLPTIIEREQIGNNARVRVERFGAADRVRTIPVGLDGLNSRRINATSHRTWKRAVLSACPPA